MSTIFQIIFDVLSRVITLYIGVTAGLIFIKSPLKKFKREFIWITINIFTPFLIFISFLSIELDSAVLYPIFGAILVTIIGVTAPKYLVKLGMGDEATPAEISTATFPNALNFPFPIIYAFAPGGLGIASIFLGLSTIARNTVGFWIAGTGLDRDSLKKVAMFPPIWGIILGIIVRFTSPNFSTNFADIGWINVLFQIGIFATIMTVGFGLKLPHLENFYPIFRTGLVRFVIMGLIGFITVIVFQPSIIIAIPFIVQLMAPPAVYNGLYAEILGLDTELTSQIIVTLTLVALLLLPFQIILIQFLL